MNRSAAQCGRYGAMRQRQTILGIANVAEMHSRPWLYTLSLKCRRNRALNLVGFDHSTAAYKISAMVGRLPRPRAASQSPSTRRHSRRTTSRRKPKASQAGRIICGVAPSTRVDSSDRGGG